MRKFKITGSISEVAHVLGLTEAQLQTLAISAPKLYRTKHEPKKDGSFRIIHAPFKHLKEVQKKILTSILNQISIHHLLHGGPNTSTKSAARVHVKQPVVITLDIQDFFPSVRAEVVCRAFEANGFNREVANLLTRLVTRKKRLPQGAPTSSAIARIVLFNACKELEALLETVSPHARATIYVDDVTISGPIGLRRLVPTIISIFRRNGYHINPAKRKVMPSKTEQVVLGLRVNHRVEPSFEFERTLEVERRQRNPRDRKLRGLESYRRFVTRLD